MKRSEQVDALAAALAKAQGQMEGALKTSSNPFFKSRYADLKSVWEACRKSLADNELSIVQSPHVSWADGVTTVTVTTLLMHASGQWIESELSMTPKDDGPQAIGTCTSYARRYALAAIVGVYQEDDDAEGAEGRGASKGASNEVFAEMFKAARAAIKESDHVELRRIWNDLNVTGDVQQLWGGLSQKQKIAARELLKMTATPAAHPIHGEGEIPYDAPANSGDPAQADAAAAHRDSEAHGKPF